MPEFSIRVKADKALKELQKLRKASEPVVEAMERLETADMRKTEEGVQGITRQVGALGGVFDGLGTLSDIFVGTAHAGAPTVIGLAVEGASLAQQARAKEEALVAESNRLLATLRDALGKKTPNTAPILEAWRENIQSSSNLEFQTSKRENENRDVLYVGELKNLFDRSSSMTTLTEKDQSVKNALLEACLQPQPDFAELSAQIHAARGKELRVPDADKMYDLLKSREAVRLISELFREEDARRFPGLLDKMVFGPLNEALASLPQAEEAAAQAEAIRTSAASRPALQAPQPQTADTDETFPSPKQFTEAQMALLDFERQYQSIFDSSGMLLASITAETDRFRQAAEVAFQAGDLEAGEYFHTLERINELQGDKLLQSATDMASGAKRGFRSFADDALDMGRNMETLVTGTFNNIGSAFQLTTEGMKFNWQSAMDSILNQAFQMLVVNPILGGISSGIGGLFSSSTAADYSTWSEWVPDDLFDASSVWPFAHGNAFTAGTGLSEFRNCIVTSPTLFPFAHGGIPGTRIGLMGEKAGSPGEVIAPLFRASNGDLGVKSISSGTSEVHVHVDVHNNSNEQVSVRESRGSNGMPRLDVLIGEIDRGMANLTFSGRSAMARAMDRTRGTSSAMALYRK